MTMNPLPPQAYTKDILLKAYQWLMGQNSSLKEMATTPDILVSLYLKATRDGDHALERPSIQNFKNELRSLAGMMGELEGPPRAKSNPVVPPAAAQGSTFTSSANSPAGGTELPTPAPAAPMAVTAAPSVTTATSSSTGAQFTNAASSIHPTMPSMIERSQASAKRADGLEQLDAGSRAMIHEVKEDFNLSSDVEALRMLIKIGYSRSRSLLT